MLQNSGPGKPPAGKLQNDYSRLAPATGGKTQKSKMGTVAFFVLVFLLWVGLVGGGYFVLQGHLQRSERNFSRQIDTLQAENQRIAAGITEAMELFGQELTASREEMEQIRRELDLIQEEMELTGESITGTDDTRQSLAERITELDQQLAGLKEQLGKLEAAVRAL